MIRAIRYLFNKSSSKDVSDKQQHLQSIDINKQPKPVYPKVLLVVFDPVIQSMGGRRLSVAFNWNKVGLLVKQYIEDLRIASNGYCNYRIVKSIEVDDIPIKIDGFIYSPESYVNAWRSRSGFHDPDWADYHRILADFDVVREIDSGQIDEVWLFAFPYGGFYESRMAGPHAFWCNAPPLDGYSRVSRRFIVMGFNFERGVGEMLESFSHRVESIMAHVFRHQRGQGNLWEKFTRYEKFPPRSSRGR